MDTWPWCERYAYVVRMLAVMMREPPDDPTISSSAPVCRFSTMIGDMDESGRLPGTIKLGCDGTYPN